MSATWNGLKWVARTVWLRPGTTRRVPTGPYAGLRFRLDPQMRTRMVVFRGAYEPEVCGHLQRVVRPGMVVWEAGAHVGIHALHVAKLLGGRGSVHAFEPHEANLATLRANIAANGHLGTSVVVVPAALGARSGVAVLESGATDGTHHLGASVADGPTVQVTTVDAHVQEGHPPPDLVIVDVEGAEGDVLAGAEGVVARHRPDFIIETHGAHLRARCEAWLTRRGYRVSPLGHRHLQARARA